ncbi:hypothetical protein I1A_002971 [Pseudomonas fluorescens R124]|uniref:Uncharacterized protein n=1 Tax=Pseudomonas fluorescens R124 TaxID=743713 RepID=A0A7U9CRX6_PSEFL|nr:hypothetical protein I1A_002971 [Pseudomonas fluorescens R124]
MPGGAIKQGTARRVERDPEAVAAVEGEVVRQAGQVVDEQVVGPGFGPRQPVAADAVGAGFVDQHIGVIRAEGHAVGKLQFVQEYAGFAGLKVITQQAAVASVFDDRFAVMAIAPAAAGVAEIGVVPGLVDRYIVGKTEGQAIGLGSQRNQPTLGVERQQTFDRIGDHQQTIGMSRQTQRPAASVGQHLALLAIEAGADQSPVMQAGDQEVALQQQCFGAVDVARAYLFGGLEPLVFRVRPFAQRRRRSRLPRHRLHLGRHQQQKRDDEDHQH